jgi:anti-sigma-K factor RskA
MTGKRAIDPAEYALGLLEDGELAAARSQLQSDPDFASAVARWNGRLAPLFGEVESADAPPALLQRITQSLGGGAVDETGDRSNVVALRRRVNVWRGLAGAMTAIAASLALVMINRPALQAPVPQPQIVAPAKPMVAMIKAGADVAAVANWDSGSRQLVVTELAMPVVRDRDYQLWLIPADGKPRSVGVMPSAPHVRLPVSVPMTTMIAEGATLAVSLEPTGGSPTDGPTGPVIASGALAAA